jgi:hypothetical protein
MAKKEYVFNKIILVGNGFDLALGLKTSYQDFLFWYLKKLLNESALSDLQETVFRQGTKHHIHKNDLVDVYCNKNYKKDGLSEFIEKKDSLQKLMEYIRQEVHFSFDFKSNLFNEIIQSSITNWVDIEAIYYKLLTDNLKQEDTIEKLNKDFSFIKNLLEEYLSSLKTPSFEDIKESTLFSEQLFDGLGQEEVIEVNPRDSIIRKDVYFLNFNYTNTLKNLLDTVNHKNTPKINYTINHIHGKLNSKEEEIIFGYGDEMDQHYNNIQDLNENLYLQNIKSFQYFRSPNYRNLLRFVNSNEYQVCIYGHSCGLSDRVMLNEIFENENCKSIKVYYHKDENDFTNKTMAISRHFKDNNSMRKKIVNFNSDDIIPQIKDLL